MVLTMFMVVPRHLYGVKTDFKPRVYYWKYNARGTYKYFKK